MIRAALAAWKRCGTCGHGYVNVRMLLKTAVTKYANDPEFILLFGFNTSTLGSDYRCTVAC